MSPSEKKSLRRGAAVQIVAALAPGIPSAATRTEFRSLYVAFAIELAGEIVNQLDRVETAEAEAAKPTPAPAPAPESAQEPIP